MAGKFKVQHRHGTAWEQVGSVMSWRRVLELTGGTIDDFWTAAENAKTRVHLRKDAEWRVVETGFRRDEPRDESGRGRPVHQLALTGLPAASVLVTTAPAVTLAFGITGAVYGLLLRRRALHRLIDSAHEMAVA